MEKNFLSTLLWYSGDRDCTENESEDESENSRNKEIFFFFESHSRIKARLKIARAGMQGDYEMERFRYIDTLIAVYVTCCFCPRQTYKLLQVDATQTARELGLSCR